MASTLPRFVYRFCLYATLVLPSLLVLAGPVEQVVLTVQEPSETNNLSNVTAPPLPVYVIAHRVLSVQGVKDAINHGANALEIDLTAWKVGGDDGWWADHDGDRNKRGDTASDMFKAIAEQRNASKVVTFVWFDLKNPDHCPLDENVGCSILALQNLAREILHPFDVRVLFGFSGIYCAYNKICKNANEYESINVDGSAAYVERTLAGCARNNRAQHIMSKGYYAYTDLPTQFGNCELDESGGHVCKELRKAVVSQAFGKVFGWTTSEGQASYVDKMLGTAGVDGLIYGMNADYKDDGIFRAAIKDIKDWIDKTPGRFLAGQSDHPW